MLTEEIGAVIRARRHEGGMTIPDVAAAARCSYATVAHLELGRHLPALRTVVAICDVVGVSAVERARIMGAEL